MTRTRLQSTPARTPRRGARVAPFLFCATFSFNTYAALPDYRAFDDLLLNHVDNGFVDYDGIAADGRLDIFLQQLGDTTAADLADDTARKAFYINAYNAVAIHGVLKGQSAESQRSRRRFFEKMEVRVLGEARSMEDIEHRELRPMGDPRIHFAIVCASLSCPRLSSRAYIPERLDEQLDASAERFVNDPSRNRFDTTQGIAFLSPIFDWFAGDFADSPDGLQRFIAGYVRDADAERELRGGKFEIRYEDYDWRLNGEFGTRQRARR
ncbi:MAG: DUF547 domain-containing protein [Gammaproteobacteria bacterium]|nr:DUF547 domain-containing protein [Gammaproteobacteria bacterium]